jgi:hypothetical protein
MERASKLFIIGWTCVALAADVWLLRGSWPGLRAIAPLVFALAAAVTALDRRAVAIVVFSSYLFPVLVYWHLGRYTPQYGAVWMAALLGAIIPLSVRTPWHIPARWRGPLVCWALVIAASGSIVAARELDFTPALIAVTTVANSAGGGWPAFVIAWVLHVAVGLLLGILWFDWLLALPAAQFRAVVAAPMAASALVLAAVAICQLFVDVKILNPTVYQTLGRASGTVFDANVCGTIAALWIGGIALLVQPLRRWRPHALAIGTLIGWLAVWATGSRSAFAAAAIATAFTLRGLYGASRPRVAAVQVIAGASAVSALVILLAATNLGAIGPLARFRPTLPSFSMGSLRWFIKDQTWVRNGYGIASTAMIQRYPLFGVGVGSFQSLLPEFPLPQDGPLAPDNAQNWYRHQLAELGLVGSIGWVAWVIAFGAYALRRRRQDPEIIWSTCGALAAFALISFVGMPGQEVMVSITFWTIAAGFVSIAGRPPDARLNAASWATMMGVVILYSAGTLYAARHDLRVPARAQRVGWSYMYGLFPPDPGGGDYRWSGRRAVMVMQAPEPWIELTISLDYRDLLDGRGERPLAHAPTRPVDVKIWRDGELVFDSQLESTAPVTTVLSVPAANRWLFLETQVSRVFKPREFGVNDDRELGLRVKWSFVNRPALSGVEGPAGRDREATRVSRVQF